MIFNLKKRRTEIEMDQMTKSKSVMGKLIEMMMYQLEIVKGHSPTSWQSLLSSGFTSLAVT
jgi:hypothetical protein